MRTTRARPFLRAALAVPVTVVTVAALAACGGGDGEDDGTDTTGADAGSTVEEGTGVDDGPAGVPEECGAAFPQALGPADVADLALLPDGFPDPPVEATLCITAETVGGSQETASYASDATAEEILAGYEAALASYGAARDQDGIGRPIVTAADGDLIIQVTPQDGGFVLAFSG
ncbi:hypothetical protein RB608_19265 [Nocardioides sp. LHD-245]|uniref:hypothetical protein n=1 Tax=Nocardioides sp. LHD-245 TaxID=3051387 RepID=UPI0027E110E5|nr:hypothetical protein [Nocardioides sp. LHD-245]